MLKTISRCGPHCPPLTCFNRISASYGRAIWCQCHARTLHFPIDPIARHAHESYFARLPKLDFGFAGLPLVTYACADCVRRPATTSRKTRQPTSHLEWPTTAYTKIAGNESPLFGIFIERALLPQAATQPWRTATACDRNSLRRTVPNFKYLLLNYSGIYRSRPSNKDPSDIQETAASSFRE